MTNPRERGQGLGASRGGGPKRDKPLANIDLDGIDLGKPSPEMFDEVAQRAAVKLAANKRSNKPSQLRRFFDELVMWDTKINTAGGTEARERIFGESLPFIRMMNAKAAYAEGRDLVDVNFAALFSHCIRQINSPETLRTGRMFFEALLGFYKLERPKDS